MSNRRKLRQHTAAGLTRPKADWAHHVRGPVRTPDTDRMWAAVTAQFSSLLGGGFGRRTYARSGDR